MINLGKEMYDNFQRIQLHRYNTQIDDWNDLDENDQQAWQDLADFYERAAQTLLDLNNKESG